VKKIGDELLLFSGIAGTLADLGKLLDLWANTRATLEKSVRVRRLKKLDLNW
jgi:hypothetical protein